MVIIPRAVDKIRDSSSHLRPTDKKMERMIKVQANQEVRISNKDDLPSCSMSLYKCTIENETFLGSTESCGMKAHLSFLLE